MPNKPPLRRNEKPKHLAAKLLAIRHRLGLSQSELAAQFSFDVHYGPVSEYELGKRTPNILLRDYARIAGVHVDDLVDDKDVTLIEQQNDYGVTLRNRSLKSIEGEGLLGSRQSGWPGKF